MKRYFILLLFAVSGLSAYAQSDSLIKEGAFYGDVFLNGNYNFDNQVLGFRLNRLHFGYKYNYNKHLYFNGMIESAREDYEAQGDYNGITNLFEFCMGVRYARLEGKFGLIGTELNQLQEKVWRQRNTDKVYADKYGFAPTNDFGAILKYKPNRIVSIDAAILNGNGHKSGQVDSTLRYAFGVTLSPVEGIYLRAYHDILTDHATTQVNSILIAGYQISAFSMGIEWNMQYNKANIRGLDMGGFSAYSSYDISSAWRVFGRYDVVQYDFPGGYIRDLAIETNSELIIAGVQYQINELVNVGVNSRNQIVDRKTSSYLFLDLTLVF